jgi:hypothetical protein
LNVDFAAAYILWCNARMKRFAFVLCSVAACSHHAATKTTGTPTLPAKQVQCFVGTTERLGPDGNVAKSQHARVIRTLDPAAGTIREQVDVSEDADFTAAKTESFDVGFTVSGQAFTMKEAHDAFSGTGTLVGQPWQWTSWTSLSTMGPITVESADALNGDELTATKTIKQNGSTVATTRETYRGTSCW